MDKIFERIGPYLVIRNSAALRWVAAVLAVRCGFGNGRSPIPVKLQRVTFPALPSQNRPGAIL